MYVCICLNVLVTGAHIYASTVHAITQAYFSSISHAVKDYTVAEADDEDA